MSRHLRCSLLRPVLLAGLALICAGPRPVSASAYPPDPGKAHPPITLYTLQGDQTVALSSLRGKKVLLVHFASWSEESRKTVPIWYEKAKPLVAQGKLTVLAVAHEQYADRCQLFAQWKGIDWPILHDPLNLIRVESLPLIVAIDEYGIVRDMEDDPSKWEESFIGKEFAAPKKPSDPGNGQLPDPRITRRTASEARSAIGWRKHGDALVLAGKPPQINEAIDTYRRALKLAAEDADALFRLGVAYRIRFDRPEHQNGDFQAAIDAWQKALALKPENQVFAARLLQYGPSVDKPGAFYAWIDGAEKAIKKRGETPIPLSVQPTTVELAHPAKKFGADLEPSSKSNTGDKAKKDEEKLVHIEPTVVRGVGERGDGVAAVLVTFWLDSGRNARWDVAGPLCLWIDKPKHGKLNREFVEDAPRPAASADGARTLCFEIKLPKQAKEASTMEAHAVYTIRTGPDSPPQTLRQDFEIKLEKE